MRWATVAAAAQHWSIQSYSLSYHRADDRLDALGSFARDLWALGGGAAQQRQQSARAARVAADAALREEVIEPVDELVHVFPPEWCEHTPTVEPLPKQKAKQWRTAGARALCSRGSDAAGARESTCGSKSNHSH